MAKNTNWKRYSHDHHVRNNNYNAQTVPPVNVTWTYEVQIKYKLEIKIGYHDMISWYYSMI